MICPPCAEAADALGVDLIGEYPPTATLPLFQALADQRENLHSLCSDPHTCACQHRTSPDDEERRAWGPPVTEGTTTP